MNLKLVDKRFALYVHHRRQRFGKPITFGGRFRSALYAFHMLIQLPDYGFVILNGEIVQKTPRGYRKFINGKWSRPYKMASKALAL